jgi:putative endonuclease
MPSSKRKVSRPRGTVGRGRNFESRTAQFYLDLGFEILDRNWQAGHKEIDLIARHGDLIAFIEVKSARGDRFGHPAEWVTRTKQRNLIAAAHQYLIEKNITGCDLRFDIVAFVDGALEQFPNAFDVE